MSDVRLTLEGENISFKKDISEHRAGQIISLLSTEQSPLLDPTKVVTKRSSGTKGVSKRSLRDEISSLPIDTSLEGFPGYHELPTKADKIIWILQYAEANGIKGGLSSGEIDYLSTQLKDRIEAKNFGAFNNRNVKSSYVKKVGGLFQAQHKGLTYLKNLQISNE